MLKFKRFLGIIFSIFVLVMTINVSALAVEKNNKQYIKEFSFSINTPKDWYVNDISGMRLLDITISKEEFNFSRPTSAAYNISGSKGEKGKRVYNDYIKQFNKEKVKSISYKINSNLLAKKYVKRNITYILFNFKDRYFVSFYSTKDKNDTKIIETMIKTIRLD